MELFLLFLGLSGLWIGSEIVVRGALAFSERFKISHTFFGLTILAIGTNVPELFVVITAALKRLQGIETSGLVIGETIGTSFGQSGLMLGIVGLLGVIEITRRRLKRDGLMLVAAIVFLFLAGLDGFLSRTEGLAFIIIYLIYFAALLREEKLKEKIRCTKKEGLLSSTLLILGGFFILFYASGQTIDSALALSEQWGVAQSLIGILIVGLGTSLPELATSLTAARKGAGAMAASNLIGSTTFDLLFTLGIGASISGFLVHSSFLRFDLPALLILALILIFIFLRTARLSKKGSFILIGIYLTYFLLKLLTVF